MMKRMKWNVVPMIAALVWCGIVSPAVTADEPQADSEQQVVEKQVTVAVAGQPDPQQLEAIERVLGEAGLEGEALSQAMEKIKTALAASKVGVFQWHGGPAGLRVQVQGKPSIVGRARIVGPDGQAKEVELSDLGQEMQRVIVRPRVGQLRQIVPRALDRKRLWDSVEKSLQANGMVEEQIATVRKALDDALAGASAGITAESAAGAKRYVLGLSCGKPSEELDAALSLEGKGTVVEAVFDELPAKESGVQEGDVVVKANGQDVTRPEDLVGIVQKAGEAGDRVVLTVIRDGESIEIEVTPTEKEKVEVDLSGTGAFGILENLPGIEGLSEIGPGIIRLRGPQAAQQELDALKKRLEELEQRVSELQQKFEQQ